MPPTRSWIALAGWTGAALLAGLIGGVATRPGEWYASLDKPAWTPPGWIFGPVWTILYLMMGVAAWLVWERRGTGRAEAALTLFVVQLALNALWSWLFFGWHRIDLAVVEILILWLLIAATLSAFVRVRRAAGALLVPYLLWVSFAGALTLEIWRRNGG